MHNNQNEDIVLQPPLYFAENNAQIWNVCFHPSADVIACSQINGNVAVLSYNSDSVDPLIINKTMHRSSVRYCSFNPSGNILASCGQDKRIGFLDGNGKQIHVIKKAHPQPIYRCKFMDDKTLISGDDDGLVKIWDLRTGTAVYEAQQQSQAITGITFMEEQSGFNFIYTSSLDGTIAVYDLRQTSDSMSKLFCRSDSIDEELTGIQILKNGKYLLCPTSERSLVIYKKDQPEDFIDRIQGPPGSINCLVKLDENSAIIGSEDGYVRGIGLYPNKILQVLGQHEEDAEENFPVESVSISHCKKFLASSSHDCSIKFYDINEFMKKRMNVGSMEMSEEDQQFSNELEKVGKMLEQKEKQNAEDSQDFEDDSDSSSQSEELQPAKRKKKPKNLTLKTHQKQMRKQKSKSFFKGL